MSDKPYRRRRRQRLVFVTVVPAIAGLLLSACSSTGGAGSSSAPGVSGSEIQIGVTTSLSGVLASTCKAMVDGYRAEVSAINARGGVNGRKINLIELDDANDGSKAQANARELVSKPVFALFSECSTSGSVAMAPYLNAQQVPFVFSFAAAKQMYNPVLPYVFPIQSSYAQQTAAGLSYVASTVSGAQSLELVVGIVAGSDDEITAATDFAKSKSWTVATESLPTGTPDWSPTAIKIKANKPTILDLQLTPVDTVALLKALNNVGYMPAHIVLGSANSNESFVSADAGLAADRILITSPIAAASSLPADSQCIKDLTAGGVTVTQLALWGCGTTQMLEAALNEAGKQPTRASFVDALNKWNNKKASDVFTPLTYSKDNHVALNSVFVFGISNGKLVEVGTAKTSS